MESFKPDQIADAKMIAIKEYRAAKRERDRTERLIDELIDQTFIQLKFNELKMSIEDRKARARTNESVIELKNDLEKAQEKMDNSYAELERVITKIDLMLDANATNRQEMKLGNIITWKFLEWKKLWHGRISLRDYVVEKQIKNNEPIKVLLNDEEMILSVRELEKRDSITKVQSKYNGLTYKLYDYVWSPKDKRQGELLWKKW